MTFALAILFASILLLYCGIKGRSLKNAFLGHATTGGGGSITG